MSYINILNGILSALICIFWFPAAYHAYNPVFRLNHRNDQSVIFSKSLYTRLAYAFYALISLGVSIAIGFRGNYFVDGNGVHMSLMERILTSTVVFLITFTLAWNATPATLTVDLKSRRYELRNGIFWQQVSLGSLETSRIRYRYGCVALLILPENSLLFRKKNVLLGQFLSFEKARDFAYEMSSLLNLPVDKLGAFDTFSFYKH